MYASNKYPKDLSIVVALYNEAESLPELVAWIRKVMEKEGYDYELIMVDDGSRDGSWAEIRQMAAEDRHILSMRILLLATIRPVIASKDCLWATVGIFPAFHSSSRASYSALACSEVDMRS